MAYFYGLKCRNASKYRVSAGIQGVICDAYYVYQVTPYDL